MTQRAPTTSTTFCKHIIMTIFAILNPVQHTRERGSSFLSSYQDFFLSFLVRNGLNAEWFLVNSHYSHYKCLCASLCTFETVQKIKVG